MSKTLVMVEVSRKQDYIFASKKLRVNAERSAKIAYVTGDAFFRDAAPDCYSSRNLIYAGGGHTVLQFDTEAQARAFAQKISLAAMERFCGMELFLCSCPYDPEKNPGENFLALTQAMEQKKALRKDSFHRLSLGVEVLDNESWQPVPLDTEEQQLPAEYRLPQGVRTPAGHKYANDFRDLLPDRNEENFIAVVHADGNAMGKRVQDIYQSNRGSWDTCCSAMRRFSENIQNQFAEAFNHMTEMIAGAFPSEILPIRPVILAGDDICFVCAGDIALKCTQFLLQELTAMENPEQPGRPYAACGGIAMVHLKYPFHQAYNLAEQLCDSAKKFGASIRRTDADEGKVSAMDWHIEFGQMKSALSEIREDYAAEDGTRLELRPLVVHAPAELKQEADAATGGIRTWEFFRTISGNLDNALKQPEGKALARGKLKNYRDAMRQGEIESRYYLIRNSMKPLLKLVPKALQNTATDSGFCTVSGVRRALFFDAVETADHIWLGEEEQ